MKTLFHTLTLFAVLGVIATPAVVTADHHLPGEKTIAGAASSMDDFSTLVAALKAADLVGAVDDKDASLTVFAPTNAAFAKLPAGTVDALLKPENKPQLQAILKYHVLPSAVPAAEAMKVNGPAATLEGSDVMIKVVDGKVMVGDATVVKADVNASNGVIHVIDTVLLPPKK